MEIKKWICNNCTTKYEAKKKGCAECNSKSARPDFILERRKITNQFTIDVQDGRKFGLQKYLALNKFHFSPQKESNITTNSIKIYNPQQLSEVLHYIKELVPACGWEDYDDLIKKLREIPSNNKEVPPEVEKIIRQCPSTFLDLLKKTNYPEMSEDNIDYIAEVFQLLHENILNAGEGLMTSFKNLTPSLSKQNPLAIDQLKHLLGKVSLMELTSVSSILLHRLQTLELFEEMIHTDSVYEIQGDESIHNILEKNMWMIDETYWLAQSNKSIKQFIQKRIGKKIKLKTNKRPDFVCVSFEGKLIIIEIKRPSHTISKKDIDQLENYIMIAEDYTEDKVGNIEGYIVGNKFSPEAGKILKRRSGIKKKTYSDLVEKCKKRYKEYLQAIEKAKKVQSKT